MGEVYRAHDPRLGRDVALKVLPADMAADPARLERFTREARAIAALNHPHIVTIFSTEEADTVRFLTMELVDGQTLDALIPANGFPLARFLELALPLADALTAAHQKQITHRDLKPANVMVTHDGRVKVLDFGLARVGGSGAVLHQTIEATRPVLTSEGTIVGTMPYMSPEQIEGKTLDHRTDLFSLGVMFHEMLTGSRPFTGDTSPQLMSSILRDAPSSTSDIRPDVPQSLSRLIQRCLEKRPEDRVQTARDIYNELRHVQKQLESGARQSDNRFAHDAVADSLCIVVLPFGTRGSDPDGAALAAGLTEDITAGLARFGGLSVASLQSAASVKDSPLDARQAAERLGARFVIGGTVRKAASGTRVTAHLTDARSSTQLWTETYDRGTDADIFEVQDEVTDRVVATVADAAGVLARALYKATEGVPVDQLSARQLVHRCWGFQKRPHPEEHAELRAAVERLIAREPENVELLAELALLYVDECCLLMNPLPDPIGRAVRTARRAIEINPSNQGAWVALAFACFFNRDEAGFVEAADRTLKINPRHSQALAWIGALFTHMGHDDRGLKLTERAMALNPSHAGTHHFAPFTRHFERGEYTEALKAARRVNIADFMWMHLAVAAAAGHLGLTAEGKAAVEALERLSPALADETTLREFLTRWFWNEDVAARMLDGVRRAKSPSSTIGTTASPARPRSSAPAAKDDAAPRPGPATATWIAVMCFSAGASDDEASSLADGLTEEITAGLARFPLLSVVAAHSARRYKGTTADAREIGRAVGARYLLDGGVRRAGSTLRIAARLVDTDSGAQLWSETYTRDLQHDTALGVQDDVTDRVVATLADVHGVLIRSMSRNLTGRPIDELGPEELRLRYWSYHRQHDPGEHGILRDHFEQLAGQNPSIAAFFAVLAHLYLQEYGFGFNARPDPLARTRRAVDRALELDPLSQHAWEARAFLSFFERDRDAFAHAVDRVLTLNPRNANATALMGILLIHTGEFERGSALADRAMALNPDHPGWYHIAHANRDYALANDEGALRAAKRINMPKHVWAHVQVAIAAGQLGRAADAAAALDALFSIAPDFADEATIDEMRRRWKWRQEDADRMLDGYRKAVALRNAAHGTTSSTTRPASASGVASDAFVVTVLQFASGSNAGDAIDLADGLTQGIAVGLSRFSYLRVVKRNAAPESIAAGYVLHGSVRVAGGVTRVVAQLTDAATGRSLWADTYDRRSADSSLFAVQDELTEKIVATVADANGALVRAMAAIVRGKSAETLTPHEAVLRGLAYWTLFSPVEHGIVRTALERAVERTPSYADAWAMLAFMYSEEHAQEFNRLPQPVARSRAAARRALELDASNQLAHYALAHVAFFDKDASAFRAASDRAIELNPLATHVLAFLGMAKAFSGDWDGGLVLCDRAMALNPHHSGIYRMPAVLDKVRRGEYVQALELLDRVNLPGYPHALMARAAIYAQLGRVDEALAVWREADARMPGFVDRIHDQLSKWFTSDLVERFQEAADTIRRHATKS
jgi:TolB-like protein/Tfp pilus assembly protein PilF